MLKQGQLRGPVKDSQGVVLGDVTAKSELVLEYANFKLPLKREFFPQCEVISRYDANGLREETVNDESIVMFGVRPCDAQSLVHLDKVFSDEQYTDPYYQKRRDNSLVISLACKTPASECFCSSTGGGPYDKAGADIMSVDLGNSLFLKLSRRKAKPFLQRTKACSGRRHPKKHNRENGRNPILLNSNPNFVFPIFPRCCRTPPILYSGTRWPKPAWAAAPALFFVPPVTVSIFLKKSRREAANGSGFMTRACSHHLPVKHPVTIRGAGGAKE